MPSLFGLGATVPRYSQVHRGDSAYGPPISFDNVHVVGFTHTFPANLTSAAALAAAAVDLPSDAVKVADLHPSDVCEQVWFTSTVLRSALDPQAYAIVTLTSPLLSKTYDPNMVAEVTFDVSATSPPGSLPCSND